MYREAVTETALEHQVWTWTGQLSQEANLHLCGKQTEAKPQSPPAGFREHLLRVLGPHFGKKSHEFDDKLY